MLRSVPGAPGLPAARAAHERARAWAAEGIRQLLQQLGGGGGGGGYGLFGGGGGS